MNQDQQKPHVRVDKETLNKHIEILRAWARGEEIEKWSALFNTWAPRPAPELSPVFGHEYRIRPKPVEIKRWVAYHPKHGVAGSCFNNKEHALSTISQHCGWTVVELTGTYTPE